MIKFSRIVIHLFLLTIALAIFLAVALLVLVSTTSENCANFLANIATKLKDFGVKLDMWKK